MTPWVISLGKLFPVLLMSQLDESRNRTYFIGVLAVLALACGLCILAEGQGAWDSPSRGMPSGAVPWPVVSEYLPDRGERGGAAK